jgi:hypothetical protein
MDDLHIIPPKKFMVIILTIKKFVKGGSGSDNAEGRKREGRLEDRADHEKFEQDKREGESS